MIKRDAVIKNRHGIHCRPSAVIIKAIEGYTGKIILTTEDTELELESIFSLLSLGLKPDDKIKISVTGPDEKNACDKLVHLFEFKYDFPPKEKNVPFDPVEFAENYKLV